MKVLCSSCGGRGYVEPPYGDGSGVPAIACPCCEGCGYQLVKVTEVESVK